MTTGGERPRQSTARGGSRLIEADAAARIMNPLESAHVDCPYCGESLEMTIDTSVRHQEYIEDCQVCCKPIAFRIRISREGEPSIDARGENE